MTVFLEEVKTAQSKLDDMQDPMKYADMIGRAMTLGPGDADKIIQSLASAKGMETGVGVGMEGPATFSQPSTRAEMMKMMTPPPTPEATEVSKKEAASLLEKLKGDKSLLQAIGSFGATLAQGPQRYEQGVGGMLGRAMQSGMSTLAAGRGAEVAAGERQFSREMDQKRLGLEERRTTAAERAAAAKGDKTTGGNFFDQVKALQGELQKLNPKMTDAEAFSAASEIYSAQQLSKTAAQAMSPYATPEEQAALDAKIRDQAKGVGDLIMRTVRGEPTATAAPAPLPDIKEDTPMLSQIWQGVKGMIGGEGEMKAPAEKPAPKSFKTVVARDEAGNVVGGMDEGPVSQAGRTVAEAASREPTNMLDAENFWLMLLKANKNPEPGTSTYNKLIQAMQDVAPGFDPQSKKGTIRR